MNGYGKGGKKPHPQQLLIPRLIFRCFHLFSILDFMGIVSEREKPCLSISNDNRKRLGLAIALATDPSILLIDELVSGLSAEETDGIMEQIKKISDSGVAILIVEHNMRVIMSLCDRITVLNFGAKLTDGTPHEVVSNKEVQRAYLGGGEDA